jgi:putative NADH-flavin reductase
VLLDSARASIEGMRLARVRRLVIISSSLVDPQSGWLSRVAARTLLRHTASDQRAMEQLVTQSALDWTVLRPARLGNGVLTGQYAVTAAASGIPVSSAGMSRQDVACMMLDTVERGAHLREIVWLRGAPA